MIVKINQNKFNGGLIPVNINSVDYLVKDGDDVPDDVAEILKEAGYLEENK